MKNTFTKLLVLTLAFVLAFGLVSCGDPTPELDLKKAERNLEARDYYVIYDDECEDTIEYVESLTAMKDSFYLTIIVFKETSMAKNYYERISSQKQFELEKCELELEYYNDITTEFKSEISTATKAEYKLIISECEEDLKDLQSYFVGRDGNTVWYGNKTAIAHSLG